jgi:hypothetical protein
MLAARGRRIGAAGLSDTRSGGLPLPLPLGALGMTGCVLLVAALQLDAVPGSGSTVAWSWTLPAGSALLGLRCFQQGFVLDPAANPFGFVASNAAAATIGS